MSQGSWMEALDLLRGAGVLDISYQVKVWDEAMVQSLLDDYKASLPPINIFGFKSWSSLGYMPQYQHETPPGPLRFRRLNPLGQLDLRRYPTVPLVHPSQLTSGEYNIFKPCCDITLPPRHAKSNPVNWVLGYGKSDHRSWILNF